VVVGVAKQGRLAAGLWQRLTGCRHNGHAAAIASGQGSPKPS
jgi:hypothetical protein